MPESRWESLKTAFIVSLRKTNDGYGSIMARGGWLTRRVHFIKTNVMDTAVKTADLFLKYILEYHGLRDNIEPDLHTKVSICLLENVKEKRGKLFGDFNEPTPTDKWSV